MNWHGNILDNPGISEERAARLVLACFPDHANLLTLRSPDCCIASDVSDGCRENIGREIASCLAMTKLHWRVRTPARTEMSIEAGREIASCLAMTELHWRVRTPARTEVPIEAGREIASCLAMTKLHLRARAPTGTSTYLFWEQVRAIPPNPAC